jgi:hypothetical protein
MEERHLQNKGKPSLNLGLYFTLINLHDLHGLLIPISMISYKKLKLTPSRSGAFEP